MGLVSGALSDVDLVTVGDEGTRTARRQSDATLFIPHLAGNTDAKGLMLVRLLERLLHGHETTLVLYAL
jgi:hypothetical protein